ncbi:hypothetical protein HDU82_003307 [Entophlyctis luteolus]|nr:hypothetical protein HDU82_003307 [Entophlyctis luteolus]
MTKVYAPTAFASNPLTGSRLKPGGRRYKSCEECRMTKKKCDKGELCSRCARMGKECVYFYTWQSTADDEFTDENAALEEVSSAAEPRFCMPPTQSTSSIHQLTDAPTFIEQRNAPKQFDSQEGIPSGASIFPLFHAGANFKQPNDQTQRRGHQPPYTWATQTTVLRSRKMSVEFLID